MIDVEDEREISIMERNAMGMALPIVIMLWFFLLALSPDPAVGDDSLSERDGGAALSNVSPPTSAADTENMVKAEMRDVNLKDQDGNVLNFKKDVVGNRVAAIIPFYTTCTSAYPILVFVFSKLQAMLGERLNREVVLISVTVDPRTDIPIRMKAYARQQKAMPGWVFLTGERADLARVLVGSKILLSEDLESHNHLPVTVVGREGMAWRRFYGFPTPDQLLREIERYLSMNQST